MTSETTAVLSKVIQGDRSAVEELIELTYDDLRRLAGSYLSEDPRSNTLQPTALVHEVFVKLVNSEDVDWRSRSHFFAVGAKAMRQILVDHARSRATSKRGGGRTRVAFEDRLTVSPDQDTDVLDLHEALNRLGDINETRAKIVEMRFFGGMTLEEIGNVMDVSTSTVQRQWDAAGSWLRAELLRSSES